MRQNSSEIDVGGAQTAAAGFEDALLVREVQAGQLHAYAELVSKYQDRVFNTCLRICGNAEDARDLTQDAFLKAFASIDKFRGKSAFYTWVFRIAANMSISHRRKSSRRQSVSLDDPVPGAEGGMVRFISDESAVDPSAGMEAAETQDQVSRALSSLEPEYRAVIVLRDLEQFDYQEIADMLEIPVGTVKSRIYRGRMALRNSLKDAGGQENG